MEEDFEKKIEILVGSLKQELEKFDPVYLMSLLNQKAIHSNGPDISPSELTDGFVQKFHYINGLVVSQQLKKENDPCRSGNLDRIIELTDELFNEYAMHWIKRPSLDGSHDTKKISEYGAGLTSFLSNLYQPKFGSTEQFIQFINDQFEEFDDDFFIPQIGITVRQCIDISTAISEEISVNYNANIKNFSEIMKPVIETWKQFRDGAITLEDAKRKHEPLAKELRRKDQRIKDLSDFISCFAVSKKDFVSQFPNPVLDTFFAYFSFQQGEINKGFYYPTDNNELDVKLLMQIGNDKYFVVDAIRIFHNLSEALLQMILSSKYETAYYRHRDQITQKKTVELVSKIFPSKTIIENAYYGYDRTMEFETDLLVAYKQTLIVCEIKAKKLRDPLHTIGNIKKIKSDFRASLQEAYLQALRTLKYVTSQESASFVNKSGHPLCVLERNTFNQYLLILVTAESFRGLATQLSFLLEKGQDDPYPFAVCLFDLELLVTRLDTPDKLIDYIGQRSKLHESVHSDDELDFAGYYIRYGNLDFSEQLKKGDHIFLDGSFSKIFDEDWYEAHGFEVKRDNELEGPYFSMIRRQGNSISLISPQGTTESFNVADLGLPGTKSAKKMKGRDRNKPCPCGSGKKYKKCCGTTG